MVTRQGCLPPRTEEGHWSQHLNLRTAEYDAGHGLHCRKLQALPRINDWSLFGARYRHSSSGHAVAKM